MKKKVTLTVEMDEAQLIFKSLGKLPFEEVYELIGKLNTQINLQVEKEENISEKPTRTN